MTLRSRSTILRTGAGVAAVAVLIAVLVVGSRAADDTGGEGSRVSPHAAQFVTRSGSHLELAGQRWRPVGVNMFWLGLDDDGGTVHYPSHAAVRQAVQSAADLGSTLVRSTSMGVSVGCRLCVEPTLGHFNAKAFDAIDYAVDQARRWGLRLMIPLTDQGHYYTGGKHTFTNWHGHPDIPGQTASDPQQQSQEYAFYTDSAVENDFHDYVRHLLDHRNPGTGLRLGDDPTIAIWETGNELWDAPTSWSQQTAAFIKSLAPHALVADGTASTGVPISRTAYQDPTVDIEDAHFYPVDTATALADAQTVSRAGKVFLVGEYPLTGPEDTTRSWLRALARSPYVAGDLAWSLLPTVQGVPEKHDDGYTFHVPPANDTERREVTLLKQHLTEMRRA